MVNDTANREGIEMNSKSWMNVPYNYFYVVIYLALGASLAIFPSNQVSRDIASTFPVEISPRFIGQTLGVLFLALSFVLWQHEPRGKTLTLAMLPASVWACYTMVNLLGNDFSAWSTAVFVAGCVGLLVYNAELRVTLDNNEQVNENTIHDGLLKDKVILELRDRITQLEGVTPKVDNV